MHANRLMPNVYRKKLLAFTIKVSPPISYYRITKLYYSARRDLTIPKVIVSVS